MTITILDQNEIDFFVDYSGSYTDYIFNEGNIFNGTRRLAALRSVGPESTSSWVNVATYEDVFTKLYSEGTPIGSLDNKFVKFYSENEIYSDSMLPRPADVSILNGAKPIEGVGKEEQAKENTYDLNKIFDLDPTPRKFKIVLGCANNNAILTASYDTTDVISDNIWHLSFPFEIKYRRLERLIQPSFNKSYIVNYSGSLKIDPTSNSPINTSLTPVSAGQIPNSFRSNVYTLQWLYRPEIVHGYAMHFITLLDTLIIYKDDMFGYNVTGSVYPRVQRVNEAYYGFMKQRTWQSGEEYEGTSLSNIPNFDNPANFPVPTYLNPGPDEVFGYGRSTYIADWHFKISGWKYGAYSAMPQRTRAVFRRGKYGQLRDMLEQRSLTKFFDTKKRAYLKGPVVTTFLTGTMAYLTSSNTSLNITDSGIYDFECRSGRPFFDT